MTAAPTLELTPTLEDLLDKARRRIEVTPAELDEARKRRRALAAALLREFPGSRTYVNGSVAHGDALTPLTDIDLGVVVAEATDTHGPGKQGPHDLKDRAAKAIRRDLKAAYGDLAVEVKGRKRSILVRFRDPVAPGLPDFTADVIVAIDNTTGAGLYIPRYDSWDRSDPETHTRLVLAAIDSSQVAYARIVRLLKHWTRRHDRPLCSWNIKALALDCLTRPTELAPGLLAWFRYAAADLAVRETPDPAGVAPHPIKTNKPRTKVVRTLHDAITRLERAIALEIAGYPVLAHDELAKLFNDEDMLPRPHPDAVRIEEAARIQDGRAKDSARTGTPALLTGVGAAVDRPRRNVRSWAP